MSSVLAEFFKHNLWANLGILELCAAQPDEKLAATVPGTFGSIRQTLDHLVGAEEDYAALVTGSERPAEPDESVSLDELGDRLRRTGEAFNLVAERADTDRMLHGMFDDGVSFATPLSTFLIQAINHATEHRSQIMTILSQQGIQPPDFDGWTYDEKGRV